MTSLEKINNYKSTPTTLIYGGANKLGIELSYSIINNGGFVIMIDEFSDDILRSVSELSKSELFLFLDVSSLNDISEELERLDYVFYILNSENDPSKSISSDYFLHSSNTLSKVVKIAIAYKARFELIDSIKSHQYLLSYRLQNVAYNGDNAMNYTFYEIQRYLESLTLEYQKKSGLDARIVRVGEIVGNNMDLSTGSLVSDFAKKAVLGQKIVVKGDGLTPNYLINLKDAVSGVIKSMFSKRTNGLIFYITNEDAITTLSVSYKITEIENKSIGVDFTDDQDQFDLIEIVDIAKNWSIINWTPKYTVERSIAQSLDEVYKYFGYVDDSIAEKPNKKGNFEQEDYDISNSINKPSQNYDLGKIDYTGRQNRTHQIKNDLNGEHILKVGNDSTNNNESITIAKEIKQSNLERTINSIPVEEANGISQKSVELKRTKKNTSLGRNLLTSILWALIFASVVGLSYYFISPAIRFTKLSREIVSNLNSSDIDNSRLAEQLEEISKLSNAQYTISNQLLEMISNSSMSKYSSLYKYIKVLSGYPQINTNTEEVIFDTVDQNIVFKSKNGTTEFLESTYSDYIKLKDSYFMKDSNDLVELYSSKENINNIIFE
ncbi:hypothetical protein IPJ91_02520 [bacterium]|nr:MAG: hypothetical protein IPJ91_02520 [bacterium]